MGVGVQAVHHGTMGFRRWRARERGQDVLAAALYERNSRARERIDRWWAAGGARRDEVWRGAWFLSAAARFRFGNHERSERVVPVLEFLFEAGPTSPYRPRVRLPACLPQTAADRRTACTWAIPLGGSSKPRWGCPIPRCADGWPTCCPSRPSPACWTPWKPPFGRVRGWARPASARRRPAVRPGAACGAGASRMRS